MLMTVIPMKDIVRLRYYDDIIIGVVRGKSKHFLHSIGKVIYVTICKHITAVLLKIV